MELPKKRPPPRGGGHKAPPPRPRKRRGPPCDDAPARAGPGLVARLEQLKAVLPALGPRGTRVWVRLTRDAPPWPAALWSLDAARPGDVPGLADAHDKLVRDMARAGDGGGDPQLVLFYGDATLGWARPADVALFDPATAAARLDALAAWSRGKRHAAAAAAAVAQVALSLPTAAGEAERAAASRAAALDARAKAAHPPCAACGDVVPLDGAGCFSSLTCNGCVSSYHAVCLPSCPALTVADLPRGGAWTCPACATPHAPPKPAGKTVAAPGSVDRNGLTPDWMITAACAVFGLALPTPDCPVIRGLLDPCTNSKACPNIPAETVYDKADDGLRLSNSWRGRHVLLNPEFKSAIAWRFINRAIDEVENGEVPAIILIVRNSTDTNYFQRLRPYPKVLLRRNAAKFKDYSSTPVGFGIVIVLMVKADAAGSRSMTERFLAEFGPAGEPCLAIDAPFVATAAYAALLSRLRDHTDAHSRDHWAQCSACATWRRVPQAVARRAARDAAWTCGGKGGCAAPRTRQEEDGVHYAPARRVPVDADGRQIGDGPVDAADDDGRQVGADSGDDAAEAPATPRVGAARTVATAQPPPPPPPSVDPADVVVVDVAAVKRAARLPPRPRWGAGAAAGDGDDGDVLTALELARAARMAANRVFLRALGLGGGERAADGDGDALSPPSPLPSLPSGHPAILVAARELAAQAAQATARSQLARARSAARARADDRARRTEALRAELAALEAAEAADAVELRAAEAAAAMV